ncbi:MAG: 30S ribosomal protein S17 [Candidatus Levybacteria bacterium RIFCSPLOWO2_02_FULL_36_8b]|nr:MAG: 30S ribosomal protein S17 [Candidatus Levybacteria bacterium RIFCSPLOWO2_02_FULL_36_8b]
MKKVFEGKVISVKMQKTAVVEVLRRTPHPLYRKLLLKSKKYKVDTGDLNISLGDKVKIAETRPISKEKNFEVKEVLNKKPVATEIEEKTEIPKKGKKK